jgi:hypothetical protein
MLLRVRGSTFSFLLALLLGGCATREIRPANNRAFSFAEDGFAFANELAWEYSFDARGNWHATKRAPKPDYSLHCFVVARSARQFFQYARFEPSQPKANEAAYRRLVRAVVAKNPRRDGADSERVVIPGYANLREFSAAHERILKEECGGAWQSYLERGNWRMILPFSRGGQEKMAERLVADIRHHRPPVVHVAVFPSLAINHAVLLFEAKERADKIEFDTYDPNQPDKPTVLTFDRASRTFDFPRNNYFVGGKVNVYEIYHRWAY